MSKSIISLTVICALAFVCCVSAISYIAVNSKASDGSPAVLAEAEMVDSGIDYTESTAQLYNPARGALPVNEGTLDGLVNRIDNNIESPAFQQYAMRRLLCDLGAYRETKIAQSALDGLALALEKMRELDLTTLVSFGYGAKETMTDPIEPDSIDLVFTHIKQLSEVICRYPDVVLLIHGSMLGPWGEQHSTPMAKGFTNGVSNVALVTQKWLDCTRDNGCPDMQVSVRTESYFIDWYNYKYGTSYSGASIAHIPQPQPGADDYRVGKWDDSFMHRNRLTTDVDLYVEWLEKQSQHTFHGGEVGTYPDNLWNDVTYIEDMIYKTGVTYLREDSAKFEHWTALKYDGKDPVYNNITVNTVGMEGSQWSTVEKYSGPTRVVDWARLHLGYRYVVRESLVSETVESGGALRLSGKIENVGFAPILVKTKASVLIANSSGIVKADVPVNIDLNSGEYDVTVNLPTLNNGEYSIYLKVWRDVPGMPDNRNQVISFANNGEFAHTLKYNDKDIATNTCIAFNNADGIKANKMGSFSIGNGGFTIDKKGTHEFPKAVLRYSVPAPLSVTVTNTADAPTGELAITSNSAKFTVSETSIGSIGAGGTDTFNVAPASGIAVGTYTAAITVKNSAGFSSSFNVTFTVVTESIVSVTLEDDPTYMIMNRGDTYQFSLPKVNGVGNPSPQVKWTIVYNPIARVYAGHTFVHEDTGFLSIGNDLTNAAAESGSAWIDDSHAWTFKVHADAIGSNKKVATVAVKIWHRSVKVDQEGPFDFGSLDAGYESAPAAHTVTITNNGTAEIKAWGAADGSNNNIKLSGKNPDSFVLSMNHSSVLPVNEKQTFTVQPKSGLAPGKYSAVVSVWDGSIFNFAGAKAFEVTFTVTGSAVEPSSSVESQSGAESTSGGEWHPTYDTPTWVWTAVAGVGAGIGGIVLVVGVTFIIIRLKKT